MADRLGNAALLWAATSDVSRRVHLLQAPLRQIRAGHSMEVFTRESLDRSGFERVAVGDGAPELLGTVRYDHDPEGLMDAIVAGSQGLTLTYVPDLSDPDQNVACHLIEPVTPAAVDLDPQRGVLGDQSVELRLRLTTQGPFDPLYHGSAVLFSYRAGGSLEQSSSFGRVTNSTAPATFASNLGGAGYGTLTTAPSNTARIDWRSTGSSDAPRTFPTLLLEDTRSNLVDESEDFGQWADIATPIGTSGQTDPYGTSLAWLLEDDSATFAEGRERTISPSSSGPFGCSLFVKEGPSNSTSGGGWQWFDANAAVNRLEVAILFSSGEPTLTVNVGSTAGNPERWRDGWWRVFANTGTDVDAAAVNRIRVYPAGASSASAVGNMYFFGAQIE